MRIRGGTAAFVVAGTVLVVGLLLGLSVGGGSAPAVTTGSAVTAGTAAGTPSTTAATRTSRTTGTTAATRSLTPEQTALRAKALPVLATVDATGAPPPGYVGGRQFMNDGRGGTTPLPRRSASGRVIVYHEYDVNPRRPGVDRGPQRLVVGDDGSAWATGDHYVTWLRLR